MRGVKKLIDTYKDIPNVSEWNIIKPIDKGWSKDKKYYIQTIDRRELLLRISDIKHYEDKKKEYESLELLSNMDMYVRSKIY